MRYLSLKSLYKVTMLVFFLISLNPYFFWKIPNSLLMLLVAIISLVVYFLNKSNFRLLKSDISTIVLLLLLVIIVYGLDSIIRILYGVSLFISTFILFMASEEFKREILVFVTKAFAILLGISALFFLAKYLFHIPLSGNEVKYDEVYSFTNYRFFLMRGSTDMFFIPRFHSIFLEPGHVGMITSYLLLANSYDFRKWYNIILLIVSILTFSLASYVLVAIGMLLYFIRSLKSAVMILLLSLAMLTPIYIYSVGSGNMVDQLIISRLVFENGDISGNNRTSSGLEEGYKKLYDDPVGLMFGVDYKRELYSAGNAGYKLFIFAYGLIGLFFTLLLYLSLIKKYSILASYPIFLLYSASFLQRAYPLWSTWLLIFICGVSMLESDKEKRDALKLTNLKFNL